LSPSVKTPSTPNEHSILPLSGGVSGGHVTKEKKSCKAQYNYIVQESMISEKRLYHTFLNIIYSGLGYIN